MGFGFHVPLQRQTQLLGLTTQLIPETILSRPQAQRLVSGERAKKKEGLGTPHSARLYKPILSAVQQQCTCHIESLVFSIIVDGNLDVVPCDQLGNEHRVSLLRSGLFLRSDSGTSSSAPSGCSKCGVFPAVSCRCVSAK